MILVQSIRIRALACIAKSTLLLVVAFASLAGTANADLLWYNGDSDGNTPLINQNDGNFQQILYNDFNVPQSGWLVQSVWSNNIFTSGPPTSTTATWAIFKDFGTALNGTLVATGDSPATLVPTGAIVAGSAEYTLKVSGLSVPLTQGTYWLGVYPDNANGGLAGNSTTVGLNGFGSPIGNNNNLYGTNLAPQSNDPNFGIGQNNSFGTSAGIAGLAPEPGSVILMCLGAIGLFVAAGRRKA